jgi:hypothetical protein
MRTTQVPLLRPRTPGEPDLASVVITLPGDWLGSGPARFDDGLLAGLPGVTRVEHEGQHVIVTGTGELASAVILALHAAGVQAREVQLDTSSLEDAVVRLTGRHLHQEAEQT